METVIDWSKAPENCVGALAAKVGNSYFPKVTFAKSVIHEHGRVRGESCDGDQLCAYLDVWIWEDRPWKGDGLPPVGTVCEHRKLIPGEKWTEVEIVAHRTFVGDDYPCAVFVYSQGSSHSSSGDHFRPCRTPEQIEAEARQKGIEELGNFLCTNTTTPTPFLWEAAQKIYDAGYRKQVAP